jgi:hypothetical protein
MLSYWNYLGIPDNDAPVRERAAFHATAAIYLQDTVVDHALFFRGDSGKDPHYNFTDPSAIFNRSGNPDERTATFAMVGKAMSGKRLAASGSDSSGFACIASTDDECIRILLSNFVPPQAALEPRQSDDFTFRIPIGEERIELSFRLPPQRKDLAAARSDEASIYLQNLPWPDGPVAWTTWSIANEGKAEGCADSAGRRLNLTVDIPPQTVMLIELRPHAI